ncbi:MAG: CPBP family intramembrane glutamic endopeptidase [Opitutales bacterium]
MGAATLLSSVEFSVGGYLALGMNLTLAAAGAFLLLRSNHSAVGRSTFKVKLWETKALEAVILTACLLFGIFGPGKLGFLPILLAFLFCRCGGRTKYPNLVGVHQMTWVAVMGDAFLRLLKTWPGLLVLSFIASLVLSGHPEQEAVRKLANPESLEEALTIAGYAMLVAPVLEEFLFRGILYRVMKRPFGMGPAIVLSAFLFALAHKNVLSFLPLIFLGVFLALAYERTGDLRTCILMHAFFNMTMILFVIVRHAF